MYRGERQDIEMPTGRILIKRKTVVEGVETFATVRHAFHMRAGDCIGVLLGNYKNVQRGDMIWVAQCGAHPEASASEAKN